MPKRKMACSKRHSVYGWILCIACISILFPFILFFNILTPHTMKLINQDKYSRIIKRNIKIFSIISKSFKGGMHEKRI